MTNYDIHETNTPATRELATKLSLNGNDGLMVISPHFHILKYFPKFLLFRNKSISLFKRHKVKEKDQSVYDNRL